MKNCTAPRTSWGDPDLRGVYLTATYTPLQRPPELANKPFYTEEEAVAAVQARRRGRRGSRSPDGPLRLEGIQHGGVAGRGQTQPAHVAHRRSCRTGGCLRSRLRRKSGARPRQAAAKQRNPAAGILTFGNTYTRCVLGLGAIPLDARRQPGCRVRGGGGGRDRRSAVLPEPGYVTLVMQSNNDVRIIPLDGRPHVSNKVRHWFGDSRGRWEGNTLVVETTNFKDRRPGGQFPGSTDALTVVERFTRIAPNTMRYQYTMTDPKTWTRPWSVDSEMPRVEPNLIYEFACHEQNYGVINVVRGRRSGSVKPSRLDGRSVAVVAAAAASTSQGRCP